ncbi:MAG: DUF2461 domain-containing protein [Ginsengibacter sp.]
MIEKETFRFLLDLQKNNNRPWFEKNKPRYERAKENYLSFINDLLTEVRKIETIHEKELKKYPTRIYRDLRFSKDKRPYKSSISSIIERAPESKKCGYYIHLQPGNSFIGGGIWQPSGDLLARARQEIDYNSEEFNSIIQKKSFKKIFGQVTGESLKRAPKGYNEDNENIELLKLKEYLIVHRFEDDMVCSKAFVRNVIECYKTGLRFLNFFDVVKAEK